MPYVPSPKTKLVYALTNKRISEEEFFREFPASREKMGAVVLGLLERSLAEKNPDFVESAIPLAYRYGLSKDYLDALNALALEPWHFRHEDVAFALGAKAVHALENIQTPEAILALEELAKNENQVIRDRALERLRGGPREKRRDRIRKISSPVDPAFLECPRIKPIKANRVPSGRYRRYVTTK